MSSRLFVYGTLEFPEVMRAVTGRLFPARSAVLEGYRCAMLEGRRYPGIALAPGSTTHGLLYSQIDSAALHRLDLFETTLYERRSVAARLANGALDFGEAYVVAAGQRGLLGAEPWDRVRFAADQLADYVADCEDFRREIEPPESIDGLASSRKS